MAILVPGKSECGICGKPIMGSEKVASFPPIIANRLDPMAIFSDGNFHSECFRKHPLSSAMLVRYELYKQLSKSKTCEVCGSEITCPEDFLCTGAFGLPDNPRFDYRILHKSCIPTWQDAEAFRSFLAELRASQHWDGPALSWLILIMGVDK